MLEDKKIFQSDLKVVKTSDYPVRKSKGSGAYLATTGDKMSEAIENADGIPFQLIFGKKPGDGYYLVAGEGFRQLLGIDTGDLTERLFIEMIREIIPLYENIPADIALARKKFINGEIEKYKAEILITIPGGEKKWISDSSLPLRDEETGKVIGSVGILFDITERKNTLAHLKKANEKAVECERLKTAFLHNLSHEVRTPLNAIIGFSSLICEPEQEGYKRKEYLDIINNSADHLLDMMNNIFEISRLDSNGVTANLSEVNLRNLMQRVYDRFVTTAENKDILLRFDIAPSDRDLVFMTDEAKLIHVLSSLVNNAIKFTNAGKVDFGYFLKDDTIEFYISDTGIGIPDEHKQNIFTRFYQAESGPSRAYSGTGLGLAISKAYIELLGGSIWVKSQLGRGSEFRFRLGKG